MRDLSKELKYIKFEKISEVSYYADKKTYEILITNNNLNIYISSNVLIS